MPVRIHINITKYKNYCKMNVCIPNSFKFIFTQVYSGYQIFQKVSKYSYLHQCLDQQSKKTVHYINTYAYTLYMHVCVHYLSTFFKMFRNTVG